MVWTAFLAEDGFEASWSTETVHEITAEVGICHHKSRKYGVETPISKFYRPSNAKKLLGLLPLMSAANNWLPAAFSQGPIF